LSIARRSIRQGSIRQGASRILSYDAPICNLYAVRLGRIGYCLCEQLQYNMVNMDVEESRTVLGSGAGMNGAAELSAEMCLNAFLSQNSQLPRVQAIVSHILIPEAES